MTKFVPILMMLLAAVPAASAATFNVTKTTDTADGTCDADCSLREAVIAANAAADVDTINVPAGTYTLGITGRGEDNAEQGDLDLLSSVSIIGAGATITVINGAGIDRVFDLISGLNVNLSDMTIKNGNPGSGNGDKGGGIENRNSILTVTNAVIESNFAGRGGGIDGGGGSTTIVSNSLFRANSAASRGGAIMSQSATTVTNTTLSANSAAEGGGLFCGATCTATVTNLTVTGNTATSAGGGFNSLGTVDRRNTLVAINTGGDCVGTFTSSGYNLDGDGSCPHTGPGDFTDSSPMLGPLQDNGGPTFTHALLSGSPAIDTGDPTGCPPPANDQRGFARPVDGDGDSNATCDIGAYEASVFLKIIKRAFQSDGTPIPSGSTLPKGMPVKFLLYINNPGGLVVDVSMRDVLDPAFLYVSGSVKYDNSVANCTLTDCTAAEEAAIFAAADSGTVGTDPVNGDVVSFTGVTLDIGNQSAANAQLDIAGGKVWAVVFTIRMQ